MTFGNVKTPTGVRNVELEVSPGFEFCPYEKNHIVRSHRMEEHLTKCREAYKKMKISGNERVMHLFCKWNPKHQVLAPELKFHEDHCADKDSVLNDN